GASKLCCAGGTNELGTQCAFVQVADAQLVSFDASTTGGPVHGHESTTGGLVGASHAIEQAPVGFVGSAELGSKHGVQRSVASHVSWGKSVACAATAGKHVETQRPSAPATDVQVFGTAL